MKRFLAFLLVGLLFVAFVGTAFAQVRVHGYTRSDGSIVQPHYRSTPNSTPTDNYSFKGNTNPYTGQEGNNYYRHNPNSPYYDGSQAPKRSNSYGFGN